MTEPYATNAVPPMVKMKKLKYLEFVQVVAEYVCVCLLTIYECIKDNSGPLKSGVQTVENMVRTVIGPVYDKFHDVPFELLNFVDRKVDELITKVNRHVPSLIKQASRQARAGASEVVQAGAADTARKIAKTMYTKNKEKVEKYYSKYDPLAEHYYPELAWSSLNRLPLVSLVWLLFRLMGNLLWRFNLVGLLFRLMFNLLRTFKDLFNLLRRFTFLFKLRLRQAGWRSMVRLHP